VALVLRYLGFAHPGSVGFGVGFGAGFGSGGFGGIGLSGVGMGSPSS
jgi:hypothetical protein